jgi:ketosteroid isomerase-like protein
VTVSPHETTIRGVYEAANRRDTEGILAGTHEEVEVKPVLGANVGANVYRGHAGIRRWLEDLWGDWDTFQVSVGEVIERGDRLLYPVGMHGRGRASGVELDAEIFHLAEMRDGLMVRIEGFTEREPAMKALESA